MTSSPNLPPTATVSITPYEALGGEAGVRQLVDRFYALMDELPEAHHVRTMHPENLQGSAQTLQEQVSDTALRQQLTQVFAQMADHMINT